MQKAKRSTKRGKTKTKQRNATTNGGAVTQSATTTQEFE
jgi:hypothetical protein